MSGGRPWYGQIRQAENPEAAAIWRSRNDEPIPCEPALTADHYVTDMVREAEFEHGSALWQVVAKVCKPREATVIIHRYCLGATLVETAEFVGVSRSRVLQIENKALRRVRAAISGTKLGEPPYWGRRQIPKAKRPVYAWESANV